MALNEPLYIESNNLNAENQRVAFNIPDCNIDPLNIAETFIRDNTTNPVTASDIAAAAGLNTRALQRLFRKKHAATPTQFLLNVRIAVAREMILRGEVLSVRQIAAQLQFSNPSRFSKLYRKIHTHIPSEEIRQLRTGEAISAESDQ